MEPITTFLTERQFRDGIRGARVPLLTTKVLMELGRVMSAIQNGQEVVFFPEPDFPESESEAPPQ